MAHPVTWFQISGRDGNALQQFYKQVFGWQMNPSPDGSMAMVSPEQPDGIAGGIGPSMDGNPSVAVYVNCDDVDEQLAKIEAAGGRTAMSKTELPAGMGFIAGFIDPGGNWVGLWTPGKDTATPPPAAKKPAAKKPAAKKPVAKKPVAKKAAAKKPAAKKPAAKKAAAKKR
jgi:predicted enzyme related to lactoylglutathione lyase